MAVWPSLRVAVTVQRASSLDHEACVTLCPKRMWSVMPFSRAVSSMYSRMSVPSARLVLLDEDGAVLLFCGSDPAVTDGSARKWWFTVGGQALNGEKLAQAAVRELAEETGLRAHPDELTGPIWRRDAMIDFNGSVMRSREFFFVLRTRRFEPSAAGRTALERRYIHGHRWCDAAEIVALAASGETVYPLQLGELLPAADAAAGGTVNDEPLAIR